MDRFSTHKVIELQLAGTEEPRGIERYGDVFELQPPRVKLRVPRNRVPETLNALLANYAIEDVGVHERPLEEVMAELFTSTREAQ